MDEDPRKRYFPIIVAVLSIMFIQDAIRHWKTDRGEVVVDLLITSMIIVLYYLNYRNKLSVFSKAQAARSLLLVGALVLMFVMFLVFVVAW